MSSRGAKSPSDIILLLKPLGAIGEYISSLRCAHGQDYHLFQNGRTGKKFLLQANLKSHVYRHPSKISSPSLCPCLIPKYFQHHVQGFSSETNFPLGQTKTLIGNIIIKHVHHLSQAFEIVLVLTYFNSAVKKANKTTTWK